MDDPAARHLVVARLEAKAADQPAALPAALIDGLQPSGHFALADAVAAAAVYLHAA